MHLLTTAMTLPWVEDLQSASMGWQHGRVKNDSPMALEFLKQMHLMFFGRLCVGVSKLGITMHPSQHQASGGHRFFDCQCFNVSSAFCPFYHWGILGQLVIQVALSVTRIPGLCLTTWSTSIFAVKKLGRFQLQPCLFAWLVLFYPVYCVRVSSALFGFK